MMGSQATREADGVLYTRAGPRDRRRRDEDVRLPGRRHVPARAAPGRAARRRCRPSAIAELVGELKRLPHCIDELIERRRGAARGDRRDAAGRAEFFLYIGRHVGLPVALEGALKLKEISYISTDAYAAGEMKHGPIALLDEETPVVCVATARRCSRRSSPTSRRCARAAPT